MVAMDKRFAFLLIAVILIGGCIQTREGAKLSLSTPSNPLSDLDNTHWFLKEMDNASALDDITITLDIAPSMFSGTMVCNDYFFAYEIQPDGGWIFILKDKTVMQCPQPLEDVEEYFLTLLGRTHHYKIRDGALLLGDEEKQALLTFSRQPIFSSQSKDLLDQVWQLDNAEGIQNTPAITVRFEKDSLQITTACSKFSGSYQMENERIRITGMKSEDYNQSCKKNARATEQQFLNLLSGAVVYHIDDDHLSFYSPKGEVLLSFIPRS